jgi:hypothetical protein
MAGFFVPGQQTQQFRRYATKALGKDVHMEIDNSWMPTLLCALNDGIEYNDHLKRSETVKDPEEIEEWMLQMYQFRHYLREQLSADPKLYEQYGRYLRD